jgi:hypothetical protein
MVSTSHRPRLAPDRSNSKWNDTSLTRTGSVRALCELCCIYFYGFGGRIGLVTSINITLRQIYEGLNPASYFRESTDGRGPVSEGTAPGEAGWVFLHLNLAERGSFRLVITKRESRLA